MKKSTGRKKNIKQKEKRPKKTKESTSKFLSLYNLFRSKFSKPFLFVLLLCMTIFVSHTVYVFTTFAYPQWDEHKYLAAAIHFLPVLQHPDIRFFSKMLSVQKEWLPSAPPLYPFLIDIPLLLFGTFYTYKIAMWINVVFYIATILGVFFIGKEFFSKKISSLAAFTFACYGFPLFYLDFVYTETVATAFTVLALYFLLKINYFQQTKYVLLFGLSTAFAVLTRWTTPLFILGPLCLVIAQAIAHFSRLNKSLVFKNICGFLLMCLIPLVVYYLPNRIKFLEYIHAGATYGPSWMPALLRNPFSGHSFIWYLSIIAQQTIWFYLLFLCGFFLCFFYFKKSAFLLGAFMVPFIFFTYISVYKDDRFIVPLYPIIALISAEVFHVVEKKKWDMRLNLLGALTIIIGICNFFGTSWGIGPMKFSTSGNWQALTLPNSILAPMLIGHPRRIWLAPISWPPRTDEGRTNLIFNTILSDWKHKKNPPRVLLTYEMTQVNEGIVSKISYEQIGSLFLYNLDGIEVGDYQDIKNRFITADYIIVKNGIIDKNIKKGQSLSWDTFIQYVRIFNKAYQEDSMIIPSSFTPIKTITIPFDKSTLVIFRKQKELSIDEWEKLQTGLMQNDPSQSAEKEKSYIN